jgi:hypothetical protein
MQVTLTIIRYKTWQIPFAFFSMAIFRVPLSLNKNISFYKLMGSGKNGSFDKTPDLKQWAILTVHSEPSPVESSFSKLYGSFIGGWIKKLAAETSMFILEPLEGHGTWDKKDVFGNLNVRSDHDGRIAVLTRASIKVSKMKEFWANVPAVSQAMKEAKGLQFSIGIGEVPWLDQATFSVWENKESMKAFAYGMKDHSDVIRKTRQRDWYKEEMFVRFRILKQL